MNSLATEALAKPRHRGFSQALPAWFKKEASPVGPASTHLLVRRERDGVTSQHSIHGHVSESHGYGLAFVGQRDHDFGRALDGTQRRKTWSRALHSNHLLSIPLEERLVLPVELVYLVKLCDLEDLVLVVELVKPRFSPTGRAGLFFDQGVCDHARIIKLGGFRKPFSLGEGLQLQAHFEQLLLGRTFLVRLAFTDHYRKCHIVLEFRHITVLSCSSTGRTKHSPFTLSSIN